MRVLWGGALLLMAHAGSATADDNVRLLFTEAEQNACRISQGSVASVDPAANKGAIAVCTCPAGYEVLPTGHCMKETNDACPSSRPPKK